MLEGAWLNPAWCVSSSARLCSHSLQQSCRERRYSLETAEGMQEAAGCHWGAAENWEQHPSWEWTRANLGVLFLLWAPLILGASERVLWEGVQGHRSSWELRTGAIQDAPQHWHGCTGVCSPAHSRRSALGTVCPGQLMAPCSVEIILPFIFQPPALCNNQILGVVLKSQYFSVKGFMMTFKVRQPSLFSLKAALIQLVSKPSWNLQQLVVKKIKTITAIVKKLERLFLFISHYFYGCPRLPVSPQQGCSHRFFFFFFPKLPSCEELGEGSKSSTSYHSSLPNDFSKRLMTRASSRALEHAECTVLPGTLLAGASCCCARQIPGRAGESRVPARPPAHSCSAWAQWRFTEVWAVCTVWPPCWDMFNVQRCSEQSWLHKVLRRPGHLLALPADVQTCIQTALSSLAWARGRLSSTSLKQDLLSQATPWNV